jgi:hypothetical protein
MPGEPPSERNERSGWEAGIRAESRHAWRAAAMPETRLAPRPARAPRVKSGCVTGIRTRWPLAGATPLRNGPRQIAIGPEESARVFLSAPPSRLKRNALLPIKRRSPLRTSAGCPRRQEGEEGTLVHTQTMSADLYSRPFVEALLSRSSKSSVQHSGRSPCESRSSSARSRPQR